MAEPVIWYLHHYAGAPSLGMAYRPYYLSKEFNKKGLSSYVIAASYHHLKNHSTEQTEAVAAQHVDGQDYIFLKTPSYQGNGLRRMLNMLAYSWRFWRDHKKIAEKTGKPSVIIVSSGHPFHFIPALKFAKKYQAKLIFEVRDLWPLSFTELLKMSPYHPIVILMGGIEKLAYRKSDLVVSLLPNALSYMKTRGLSEEKFRCIPNGIDVSGSIQQKETLPVHYQETIDKLKEKGAFLIGYSGAHGIPNALDDLLNAMVLLNKQGNNQAHLVMIGKGEQKEKLQSFAKEHRLNNVTFLDPIPRSQVMSFLAEMDVLYLGWKNSPIYQYGISPNKLFEYMLAEKPILQAISIPNDIVGEHGCGIRVNAEDAEAIACGIKQLQESDQNKLASFAKSGLDTVMSKYDYQKLADQYITLFA